MMKKNIQSGSVLLEALVALMLFATGIIGLIGLQAAAFSDVAQSKYRMEASFLANQIIASMWVDKSAQVPSYASIGGTKTAAWLAQVNNTLPGAATNPPTIVVTNKSDATGARYEVTVTISWVPPKDTVPHRYVGSAFINRNI